MSKKVTNNNQKNYSYGVGGSKGKTNTVKWMKSNSAEHPYSQGVGGEELGP